MAQQQSLMRVLTVSQILRVYGKRFTRITERYSDGHNGRCAIGVLMSYFGWNGKEDTHAASRLLDASITLRHVGISTSLVIRLNDSGMSFDEIADYLDETYGLTNDK